MHPFNQAHEVIKSHLIDPHPVPQFMAGKEYAYAYVDTANQTYHVGKTKTPVLLYARFLLWRQDGDLSGLPAQMRKVIDRPSNPLFYLAVNHGGYVYPKLKGELSEI